VSAMTKRLACLWLCLTLVLIAIATYIALSVVPADADQGNVGRILYYHLPNWVATLCCFLTNLIASITYLASRNRNANLALMADAVAVSTAEIGLLFCSLGLITGSIWGRAVWGIWWTHA
jgi:heme exporter protein C